MCCCLRHTSVVGSMSDELQQNRCASLVIDSHTISCVDQYVTVLKYTCTMCCTCVAFIPAKQVCKSNERLTYTTFCCLRHTISCVVGQNVRLLELPRWSRKAYVCYINSCIKYLGCMCWPKCENAAVSEMVKEGIRLFYKFQIHRCASHM